MGLCTTVERSAMSAVRTGTMPVITVVLKPFTTGRIAAVMTMAALLDLTHGIGTCHRQRLLAAHRHEEVTEECTGSRCNNPVEPHMKRLEVTPVPHSTPSEPAKSVPRERITEERFMSTTVIGDRHQEGEIASCTPAAINEWKRLGVMEKVG
jgi:hypothetical protein